MVTHEELVKQLNNKELTAEEYRAELDKLPPVKSLEERVAELEALVAALLKNG